VLFDADFAAGKIAFDPVQPHTLCYCMSLRISVQLKTPARKKPRQNLSAGISSLGACGTHPQERPPKALADLLAKYFSVAKSL
jgi:hypothetical protein